MNFKSYTRKSSALTGADRAGVPREKVVEVDGKWGFWEGEPLVEVVAAVTVPTMIADRRKVKRILMRHLKDLQSWTREGSRDEARAAKEVRNQLRRLRSNRQSASMMAAWGA